MQHLCEAAATDELRELRWQASDRDCARELSKSSQFLYSIDPTGGIADKISLLIQMELAQIDCPSTMTSFDSQRLRAETTRAFEAMNRLIRAVIDCKVSQQDGEGCSAALNLARSLSTKAWENGPAQLTQVPQVGKVLMRKLVGHNIRTVVDLIDTPASMIERIASRNPPFGKKMREALAWFPRLTLRAEVKVTRSVKGTKSLDVVATLGFSNTVGTPKWGNKIPIVTLLAQTSKGISAFFWRNSLKTFTRGRNTYTLSFSWKPEAFEEELICHFACEEIAGTLVTQRLGHDFTADEIPSVTKPAEEHPRQKKTQCVDPLFGLDEDISDNDLLVAVQQGTKRRPNEAKQVVNKGDAPIIRTDVSPQMGHEGNIKKSSFESKHCNSGSREKGESGQQPVRLRNGNFKCGHPCSWSNGGRTARGVQCGHQCCREGSKHPPKSSRKTGKRKAEDGGLPVPKFSGTRDCAKRAKTSDPTPRTNIHMSTGKYTVDEDGFVDLTQVEEKSSPRVDAQQQPWDGRNNESEVDIDCDVLSTFQWPPEVLGTSSGETFLDETPLSEGDDCWADLFALDPFKTSCDDMEGSATDTRIIEDIEPVTQSVPQIHGSTTDEEIQISRPCLPSNESHHTAFETSSNKASLVAVTDETCVEDHPNERKMSGEPDWVNEIDSGLIDELRGFVDFV